ncbi:MAG: GerMN domain-containing protein [Lachnospiraceae bacterium]|nr:GerMN domain-containing protein [Lachnospiraceae bacterium]
MNRIYRVFFLAFLILLSFCGCSRGETEEETGYQIYYDTPEGTQLQSSSYIPRAESFEEIMEELAGQLAQAPAGLESVLKNGVKIQGYERGIDALRIDFSGEYYELDNVDEVLLRAAVVKTFSQVPGVTGVMITVNNQQLLDEEGDPVPVMDRDDFINTKEGGINSYQSATLSLYFVDPASGKLKRELRNLHYSSNMVLENMVTEQLIQGPENSGLRPVFLDTVKILSVHVKDGICTIDFDSTVNQSPAESTTDARTALYSLVNSICDTCDGVEGVRIRIEGMSDTVFRNEIPLNQTFYMEMSEVEDYTEASDSAGVFTAVQSETAVLEKEESDTYAAEDVSLDSEAESAAEEQSEEEHFSESGGDSSDDAAGKKEDSGASSGNKSSGGMVGVDPALTGE